MGFVETVRFEEKIREPSYYMLEFFDYAHLPEAYHSIAKLYAAVAHDLIVFGKPHQEQTAAMRKLLESRDCALRMIAVTAPDPK